MIIRICVLAVLSFFSYRGCALSRDLTIPERKELITLLSHTNKIRHTLFAFSDPLNRIEESRFGVALKLEKFLHEWRSFFKDDRQACSVILEVLSDIGSIKAQLQSASSPFMWTLVDEGALSLSVYKTFAYASQLLDKGKFEPYSVSQLTVPLTQDHAQTNLILHYLYICDLKEMFDVLGTLVHTPKKFILLLKHLYRMDAKPLDRSLRALKEVFAYLKMNDQRFQKIDITRYQNTFNHIANLFSSACDEERAPLLIISDFLRKRRNILDISTYILSIFAVNISPFLCAQEGMQNIFYPNPEYYPVKELTKRLYEIGNKCITFSLCRQNLTDSLELQKLKADLYAYLRIQICMLRHPKNKGDYTIEHVPLTLIYKLIEQCNSEVDSLDRFSADLCYLGELALAHVRSCGARIKGPDRYIHYDRWPINLHCIDSMTNLYDMCNQFIQQASEIIIPPKVSKIHFADFSLSYFTTLEGLGNQLDLLHVLQKLIESMGKQRFLRPTQETALLNDVEFLQVTLRNAKKMWIEEEKTVSKSTITSYALILRRVASQVGIELLPRIKQFSIKSYS